MHNYNDVHRGLPLAAVCGKDGKPLLSWRVTLLPFIEQDELYNRFKLDEPWDSPHNIQLLALMPTTYKSPRQDAENAHSTYFQVFVGPGTPFDGEKGRRIPGDFPDGTTNTILIAEAKEAVPWTKPADLVYEPNGPLPLLGGPFRRDCRLNLFALNKSKGFVVALADASRRYIHPEISETTLRAAITRNGRETLGMDW